MDNVVHRHSTCHPVHFHLPSQMPIPTTAAAAESTNLAPKQTDPIDIPGLLDIAVKEYVYLASVTGE